MAENLRDNDNVIEVEDLNWKNSSMNYAHASRDVDDNVVTLLLKKSVTIEEASCPLKHEQELAEISVTFEGSIHNFRNRGDE